MVERKTKPILIGLSGGLDSMVAAYLLRIQKKDLFAVMISGTPEDLQEQGDALFACHASDARVSAVKKFCEHLSIPLTVIRPREEFGEEVLESWMASRLEVKALRHCWNCQQLRLRILHQKSVEMNCDGFATGHYAKLSHLPDGSVSVHSSNDPALDQSGLIVSMPQEVLRKLQLPLSELQHKEVLKIAENFQLNLPPRTVKVGQCLEKNELSQKWLETHTPPSMRKKGEIIEYPEKNPLGHHDSQADFEFGKAWKVEERGGVKREWSVIGANYRSGELQVAEGNYYVDKGAFLLNCAWDEGTDFTVPLKGFLHYSDGTLDREVLVYPKTLQTAYVELLEGDERFVRGAQLVVYKRRGKNAKVVVTGEISLSARHWRENSIYIEGDGNRPPKEISKDFNF